MSGLSSSQVVGPRSSTPNELMSRDLLCFLATWASKGRSQHSSFIKGSRQERCEEGNKREEEKSKTKSVFCDMILKVTLQHFCLTLVLKSKWLGLAHSQGKGLPKSLSTRRQRSLGVTADPAYLSTEEWRCVCLGGEKEMLGAVEDPETLKSFAKFAQVLWCSAFLPICRTLL